MYVSEAIDVGNGEHPTLPTASPLESPFISCLLVDEELESCMETSGSTKVDGQCWDCCRLFAGLRGLRVHLAKTDCGVAAKSSFITSLPCTGTCKRIFGTYTVGYKGLTSLEGWGRGVL